MEKVIVIDRISLKRRIIIMEIMIVYFEEVQNHFKAEYYRGYVCALKKMLNNC